MDTHRQPLLAGLTAGFIILTSALTACGQPVGQPQAGTTVTVTAPASSPAEGPQTTEPGSSQQSEGPEGSAPAEEPFPDEEPSSAEEPADTVLSPTPTPTITGSVIYGHTLVAHAGTWGPGDVTLTYRWFRSGAAISGATEPAYQLRVGDVGHRMRLKVTGAKEGFASVTKTSAETGEVQPATLAVTPSPTVSGTAQVGRTLTAEPGTWAPSDVSLTYRWYRAGAAISGATHNTYTLVAADLSETIKVRVSGSKPGYATVRKYSSATGAVVAGTLDAVVPALTGTAKVGHRLWAMAGEWGPAPVDIRYRWYRDGTVITGAADSSYLLQAADLGERMRVVVIGQKAGYATTGRTSAMTDPVDPGTFTFAPTPSLPSTKRVGQILNGQVTWMPIPVTMHYQWFRDAAAIPGATGHHYTVRFADLGKVIRLRVTGTKAGYTTVTRATAAGSPVQPGNLSPTPTPQVTGVLIVGSTLHANPGSWGPAPVNLSYQWKRDGSVIVGATSPSRTVTLGDRGHRLSVSVRGTKPGYVPVTRTSVQTPVVP